jgi:FMN phosphatase YigB (HAD superfamily)
MHTILFDLDGTILGMDDQLFVHHYFEGLGQAMSHLVDPQLTKKAVYRSFEVMINEIDHRTNEEKFLDSYYRLTGIDSVQLSELVMPYYQQHYEELKQYTWVVNEVVEAVRYLKAQGYQLILATNPVFPAVATHQRVKWTGLQSEDFLLVTTYENQYACKPRVEFYQDLLDKFQLSADKCWMIGNDAQEDMVAAELGIKTILLTDNLIDRQTSDYQPLKMTAKEFLSFVYANF